MSETVIQGHSRSSRLVTAFQHRESVPPVYNRVKDQRHSRKPCECRIFVTTGANFTCFGGPFPGVRLFSEKLVVCLWFCTETRWRWWWNCLFYRAL